MNTMLHIGPGTDINLQSLLESRLMIQGNSGSGKSGLARKIIEEAFDKVPFVVWDVEGEYYTLKELSPDIIIIGGEHADIPLTMELATKLPAFIVKNKLNIIVDLSDLRIGQRIKFTTDFFEALMEIPLRLCTPYLFFLEECHTLAGEQEKQDSTSAIKELMTRGRKRMFCGIPITQRIAMLNKSVAAQCNNKFIGKTTLDVDIERSRKELGFKKASDGMQLQTLNRTHFYAYGSSIEPQHVHEIIVDKPKTTMVRAGIDIDFKPGKPTTELLEMLIKLNEEEEEIQVKKQHEEYTEANEVVAVRNENQNLYEENKRLKKELEELELMKLAASKTAADRGVLLTKIKHLIEDKGEMLINEIENVLIFEPPISNPEQQILSSNDTKFISSASQKWGDQFENAKLPIKKLNGQQNKTDLSGGNLSILTACAQYPNGLLRQQLITLTGYKKSSRDVFIGNLKMMGYLKQEGQKVIATKEGIKALGPGFKPLPKGRELRDYWLNNLGGGERAILIIAIDQWPKQVPRTHLDQRIGYQKSSRDVFIGKLKAMELITIPQSGYIKAADLLFEK